MDRRSRGRFSIFFTVLVLLGVSGINVTGAATKPKLTAPSAPYGPKAPGGSPTQKIVWMAPKSNGGSPITSYTVTYYPGKKSKVCSGSKLSCTITVANPKPSTKVTQGIYYFTVIATNAIGSSPESERSPTILITFPATIFVTPKAGTPTPTPTPSPTPKVTPTVSVNPLAVYDGNYSGQVIVKISQNLPSPSVTTSTYPNNVSVTNGKISGAAGSWRVTGEVTDAAGVATVTVSDATVGTMTFTVTFTKDPVTKVVKGTGHATSTFTVPVIGNIGVDFDFSIASR